MTTPSGEALAPRGDGGMSGDIGELAKALAAAQGKIRAAEKDRSNSFFNSSYATLSSVWEACREPLSSNGLSVVQQPVNDGDLTGVVTTLLHCSGQWMRSTLWAKPKDGTPQSLGSCQTYLRRYSLSAVVGVAPDDDDGNDAQRGAADPKAGSAPAEKAKRADKVKAMSDSVMATPDQVTLIHTLKSKIGGMTDDQYRKGLAAYKKADGSPCTSSKELTEQQANNLITRFRAAIDRQEKNLREREPDLGALKLVKHHDGDPVAALDSAVSASKVVRGVLDEYVFGPYGVDDAKDLHPNDAKVAYGLLSAISEDGGTPGPKYAAAMRAAGFGELP